MKKIDIKNWEKMKEKYSIISEESGYKEYSSIKINLFKRIVNLI